LLAENIFQQSFSTLTFAAFLCYIMQQNNSITISQTVVPTACGISAITTTTITG
jgi:hypothetical protein